MCVSSSSEKRFGKVGTDGTLIPMKARKTHWLVQRLERMSLKAECRKNIATTRSITVPRVATNKNRRKRKDRHGCNLVDRLTIECVLFSLVTFPHKGSLDRLHSATPQSKKVRTKFFLTLVGEIPVLIS